MNARRSIPLALLAAATAVLATACSSSGSGAGTPGATSAAGTASASASATQLVGAAPVGSTSPKAAPTTAAPSSKPATGTGSGTGGGNATSDAYAWKHPCDPGQVTVAVQYQRGIGDTRRVIVATNHGPAACGLSYYPTVAIAASKSVGPNSHPTSFVSPKVPGGLGGAPYASIHAGQSLYAVLDLDPGHTTSGAVRTFDELDVKAADFMPDAATTNHPLKDEPSGTGNPYVKGPVLSLYQPSVADAVSQVGNLGNFA